VVYRALRARPFAAFAAVILLAVAPTLVITQASPGSDGLALALVGCALAWPFAGGSWAASGALLGLALGARASYAPFIFSLLLVAGRRWRPVLAGLSAALLAWGLPLLFIVGPRVLFHEALLQVGGHFHSWGGSLATSPMGLGERALTLLTHTARGLWPLLLFLPWRRLYVALPYALWVWLAQNPEHARHAAPLTAFLCVGAALGEARLRHVAFAATMILALMQTHAPRPWRRDAVDQVRSLLGVERVLVAGTHLPRVARYYAPELRTEPALDGESVERIVRAAPPGVAVVVASEVSGLQRPGLELHKLADLDGATLFLAQPAAALAVQP
jgi:hypothetical protein